MCVWWAPVNAPRSCPNSSLSSSSRGTAAQLTLTNGASCRSEKWWIARATSSLPVPVSPQISIVTSTRAACWMISQTARIFGLHHNATSAATLPSGRSARGPDSSSRLFTMLSGDTRPDAASRACRSRGEGPVVRHGRGAGGGGPRSSDDSIDVGDGEAARASEAVGPCGRTRRAKVRRGLVDDRLFVHGPVTVRKKRAPERMRLFQGYSAGFRPRVRRMPAFSVAGGGKLGRVLLNRLRPGEPTMIAAISARRGLARPPGARATGSRSGQIRGGGSASCEARSAPPTASPRSETGPDPPGRRGPAQRGSKRRRAASGSHRHRPHGKKSARTPSRPGRELAAHGRTGAPFSFIAGTWLWWESGTRVATPVRDAAPATGGSSRCDHVLRRHGSSVCDVDMNESLPRHCPEA